jgi:hypothetical protein
MRHLKRFNESTDDNFKEELQEFCELNLAYLLDDQEIEARILPVVGGFRLLIELNQNPQLWDDIKNHMIPFLTRLSNHFELRPYANKGGKNVSIEVTRDLEAARQNWPHRKSHLYYEIPRLINDDTKSGIFYDDNTDNFVDVLESYITEFEFLIDGYKQEPKKGILTKIKSFFK